MPTVRHSLPYLVSGQAEGHATLNKSLSLLDAFVNAEVKSRVTLTPPSTPETGDMYALLPSPASLTGAWTGKNGKLAIFLSGWQYIDPPEGCVIKVEDEGGCYYVFEGTGFRGLGVRDIQYAEFFRDSTNELTNRRGIAGWNRSNCTALTTGAPAKNILHAMPFLLPQGGKLAGVGINITAAANLNNFNLAIYRAKSNVNPYPGARIWDSGYIPAPGTGAYWATGQADPVGTGPIADVVIWPGYMHWLAYINDSGTTPPTIRTLPLAATFPVFGIDNALGTTPGYGLEIAQTHTGVNYLTPANFPGSATVKTATPVPALAYHLS
jgi:hypothetical protein